MELTSLKGIGEARKKSFEENDIFSVFSDDTVIEGKVSELIRLANHAGGKDNVTAVILTY